MNTAKQKLKNLLQIGQKSVEFTGSNHDEIVERLSENIFTIFSYEFGGHIIDLQKNTLEHKGNAYRVASITKLTEHHILEVIDTVKRGDIRNK